ncbi:hyaluronidase [Paenibacillus sp. FSL R7-0273]|uniref:protein O-GlcNAcase n=1 Tax=Paenibacillus sp. FSL R7-0273 TaxID=1536772 RepID=UPI0004F6D107|nr:beta-N-acetylglucosaminidase domain-containing protein [Paenibacillus sp. FSL R7-0273]AIQ49084.1 hyaluronidase [Paenibacillus sp. FSL R7-0273]OMF87233.1 hyaluronidase [Paenibacillus sp. FSL R7-0273]
MAMPLRERQYYFRDYYDQGEELVLEGQQLRCRLSSKFSMSQTYGGPLAADGPIVIVEQGGEAAEPGNAVLELEYEGTLKPDGYQLEISKDGKITIAASNKRGLKFGMDALIRLISTDGGKCRLPVAVIHDEPSFPVRGIIEGFYGKPWSFEDRMDAVRYIAAHRMNTFMYAPKDDPYHRELWREPYPEEAFARIAELKQECDDQLVDFYYCISPGNDLQFRSKADFASLENKLAAMVSIGVRHFALLMDDIDYELSGDNLHYLERSGLAHAYVANHVYTYLNSQLPGFTLAMCPSEYWSYWDTGYKRDIREQLHASIKVFWTGYSVFAPQIGSRHAQDNHRHYGHELWLWDNIPVNDADYDRLFLDPVRGRYSQLGRTGHQAVVANPMVQWECSKITLNTLAHYMWNSERYMPELSWELSVREFAGALAEEMMFFCRQNLNSQLYSGGYEELKEAVQSKDIDRLDVYFDRLESTVSRLLQWDNSKFKEEAGPWLDRALADVELWRAVRRTVTGAGGGNGTGIGNGNGNGDGDAKESAGPGSSDELRRRAEACQAFKVRLGSDPAWRAAEAWGLAVREEKGGYRLT